MSILLLTDITYKPLNIWTRNSDGHSINSSISVKVERGITLSPTPYISKRMCGGSGLYL
jgi:hypothetical protein